MNKNLKFAVSFLLLLHTVRAQSEEYAIQRLSLEDGLSQSSVYSIMQDHQGFIWVATEDGLNKYDGYDFTVYKNSSFDKNSLSENSIFDITEGAPGIIWISTWSTGLNRLNIKTQEFLRFEHSENDSLSISNDKINAVAVDHAGFVWVATEFGLNRLDTTNNTFKRFYHNPDDPNSLADNSAYRVTVDINGNIWTAGYYEGLSKYNPQKDHFTIFRHNPADPGSIASNSIRCIAADKNDPDYIWVGTLNGGIERVHIDKGTIRHFGNGFVAGIPDDEITAIETDYDGFVWVGTASSGLFVLDAEGRLVKEFHNNIIDPGSLSHINISHLFLSKSGIMWAGTNGSGINVIRKKTKNFRWYRNSIDPDNAISTNIIGGLMEDKESNVWVCGWNSGITVINRKTDKTRFIKEKPAGRGLNTNSVYMTFMLHDGKIAIVTGGGGLNMYDPVTNTYSYLLHDPKQESSIADNYLLCGLQASDGMVWLGYEDKGVEKWDRKNNTFKAYQYEKDNPHSLVGDEIYTIYEDMSGDIWISSQRAGISRYNKDRDNFTRFVHNENDSSSLSSNDAMVFYQASDSTFWIGTYGGGLNKFNAHEKNFKSYKEKDGLPNNVVYGILEDAHGHLWISTNKGLSRFNPQTEQFRNFDVSDGLQSNEFNSSYCKTSDGEMFFGGINGLNSFFPDEIIDNTFVPPVYITRLQILNKSISANEEFNGRVVLSQGISYTQQVELTHEDYLVSFEFAALNYINSQKNRYSYKLEGFDKEWNHSQNIRFATYRNLPPGEYLFKVKGSNNDDLWNERGIALKVIVIPAYWQTWWFKSLLFVLIIFGLVYYYRSRTRSIKSQNIKLEKAVQDKTFEMEELMNRMIRQEKLATIGKISGSIAHELRNPLGAVRQSVYYLKNKFNKVSDKMNKHLELIDNELSIADRVINDLLEMTRLKKLNKEYTDLKALINQSLQRSNINGKIKVEINIPAADQFIWGDQLQLGQVFVNLITNAYQAIPDQGTVTFNAAHTADKKFMKIEIVDNGCGIKTKDLDKIFEPLYTSKAKGTGLGLSICKHIIEKHGGEIRIKSKENKGTNVSIILPVEED